MRLTMLMLVALDSACGLARSHTGGSMHVVLAASPGTRDARVKTR
jgi:hypothetical protein